MSDFGKTVRNAAMGAAIGYGVCKAAEKAGTPDITLPDEKGKGFEEIHKIQEGNPMSVAITIFLVFVWAAFNAIYVNAAIKGNDVAPGVLFIINLLTVGVWAARRAYANTRMINAIYAYMKYATDNLEFLEFKFLREVPEPSRKALEDWNAKLEEYRKKLDAPTSDATYFPNMDNLTFKEMETVYYSFTNPEKENLRNYWAWVATRPEEERQRVLNQMEEKINREKIELYDKYASKKKGKR